MKRKILSLILVCATLLSSLLVVSCGGSDDGKAKGELTRMTVDINPSVEFMVDEENKVVSVTALNDDGSILVAGEAFVGKTPEEAVEMMVTLASDTGYLVKGNVEADENTVKISVSGDSKYAENLMKDLTAKAEDTMEKLDVEGVVAKAEALDLEALRALAASTSIYTEEELAQMDEEKLYKVIAEGRVETALLLTEDMREAYYAAKEHKISFAESEQVAKIIEDMEGSYALVHAAYKTALDLYSGAITELDEFRYNTLVSPDSEYQKSLVALREAKVELLKQKNYTASLEVNGEEYASASLELQKDEEAFDKALAAYEKLGDDLNASLESMIATLREAEAKLVQLESTLFDANLKAKLEEKAAAIDAELNAQKDSFFAAFEESHAEDIEAIEASLVAKKQELKAQIKAE